MKYLCKILFLSLILTMNAEAQTVTWQKIFGSPRNDFGNNFFQTNDGNYFLISERSVLSLSTGFFIPQTYFAKFNIYGNLIWGKYYGDSIKPNYPSSAIELPSGNILITYVNNNKGNLLKIDTYGNIIWDYTYPPPITGFYNLSLLDNATNIIVNGDQPGSIFYKSNVSKLDTNGNLIWTRSHNYERLPIGIYNDEDGFYEVGQDSFDKAFIIKRDTSGFFIWQKNIVNILPSNLFRLVSMVRASPTTFISIGQRCAPNCAMISIKFDSSGTILWERDYSKDTLSGRRITRSSNNEFAIAGWQGIGRSQLSIIDSTGNIKIKVYHYYNSESLVSYDFISNCNPVGFLVSGNFKTSSSDFSDILIMKTDNRFGFKNVSILNNNLLQDGTFSIDAYPNPFNPLLNVRVNLMKNDIITAHLIDATGRRYLLILNQKVSAGLNKFSFNVSDLNLSSGIYFLRISNRVYSLIKKIIFLK